MILSDVTDDSVVRLFSDRSKYGVTSATYYSQILRFGATVYELQSRMLTLDDAKFLVALFSSSKYNAELELSYLISACFSRVTAFPSLNDYLIRQFVYKQKIEYAQSVIGYELSMSGWELYMQAVKELIINESLASGIILSEEELDDENGDSGEDPEEPVVVVPNEPFHYAQAPLYYYDVIVGNGNFATMKGYSLVAEDSVTVGGLSANKSNLTMLGRYCTNNNNGTRVYAVNSGRIEVDGFAPIGQLGYYSSLTATLKQFILKCKLSKTRKILVEFTGTPQYKFQKLGLKISYGGYFGAWAPVSLIAPLKYRWIADNLLEIEVDSTLSLSGSFRSPEGVAKWVSVSGGALSPTGIPGYNSNYSTALGALNSLRASMSADGYAGIVSAWGWQTGGTVLANVIPASSNEVCPFIFSTCPAMWTGDTFNVRGVGNPALLLDPVNTLSEFFIEIDFTEAVTIVSASALGATIGGYSSAGLLK